MKIIDRLLSREASDVEVLQAQVTVGDAFKTWIQSDVGRYIAGRAERYEIDVLRKLANTHPDDLTEVVRLQAEAKIPGKIIQWVEDAIGEGEVAGFQLDEMMSE